MNSRRPCRNRCSSAARPRGEIAGEHVFDASISVAVARFSQTRLRRALTEVTGPADSRAAGERLAAQLPGAGLRAVFLLSDGLNVDGTPLVEGLAGALPRGVAITGGLAGDGGRFESTWVLDGARPVQRHVSAVGLYGEHLHVGLGCDGGWSDFGPAPAHHPLGWQHPLRARRQARARRLQGLPRRARRWPSRHRTAVSDVDQAPRRHRRRAGADDPRHRRGEEVAHLHRRHARGRRRATDADQLRRSDRQRPPCRVAGGAGSLSRARHRW